MERSSVLQDRDDRSQWLFFTFLLLMALTAMVLRFSHIESRVLWKDEAISVLRAAGYSEADFIRAFSDGREHTVRQMRVYQGWGSERPASAVVASAAIEDPEHPPLYFLMLFFWQHVFGGSIFWQRVLSVLIGIAVVPAMYWLCVELFDSHRTAAIGATLAALSPFFVAYSKELREYGLLALCVLVSTAVFLRARKFGRPSLWSLYALSVAAGLYGDLFFAFVVLGQAAYLLAGTNGSVRWAGITSLLAGIALYMPWLATFALHAQTVQASNDWSAGAWPLTMLAEKWIFNAGTTFFDLEYARLWLGVLLVPILAVAGYAVFFVATKATPLQKWIIGSIVIPSALLIAGSDIVLHTHRSAITRYGALFYLGLLLCMTALLGYETSGTRRRTLWRVLTLGIAAASLACSFAASQSPVWWDNHEDDSTIPIATEVNAAPHPLIVASAPWKLIYTLSFRLKDDVRVVFPRKSSTLPPRQRSMYLVTTRDDEIGFMDDHGHGIRLDPLYIASYNAVWESFHTPLKRTNSLTINANSIKLSMWRIVESPIQQPSSGAYHSRQ